MGGRNSTSRRLSPTQTKLSDFSLIRAIGRGAFGKVCIVYHRGMKKNFALKYISKRRLIHRNMVSNVFQELEFLKELDHPFIVNLWFTFQDEDNLYIINDLLSGGDLRFHLKQQGRFFGISS